jgi:uncharacterized protein (TIGR02217 family)
MAFLETPRFPDDIGYGSSGGPTYKTGVLVMASGREKRNIAWSQARHQYDVAYGVQSIAQLDALLEFFHAVRGRAHSFRFKDFSDFHTATPSGHASGGGPATAPTATDQNIGTGDGADKIWQMTKTYTAGALSLERTISKPVSGTVLVAVNAVTQTETTHYTIDYTTGIITFVTAPPVDEAITWGGQFDVPVRFDVDMLETTLDHFLHGSTRVPLVEVRV